MQKTWLCYMADKVLSCSISRNIETFCRILDENNTGSQNIGHIDTKFHILQNFFSQKSLPFPIKSRKGRTGETEGKRNESSEKFNHQKGSLQATYFL